MGEEHVQASPDAQVIAARGNATGRADIKTVDLEDKDTWGYMERRLPRRLGSGLVSSAVVVVVAALAVVVAVAVVEVEVEVEVEVKVEVDDDTSPKRAQNTSQK